MSKKDLGAFYTNCVDAILVGYEDLIANKDVIDPMCGDWHLLDWADGNGAKSIIGYDINQDAKGITLDTILNPLDYSNKFILANPPYLLSNKTKIKKPFSKWHTTDLYKASLLSFISGNAKEGILIVPSNIFYDNDAAFRKLLFRSWHISNVKFFDNKVFDDTNVRIVVFYFKRGVTTHINGEVLYKNSLGMDWAKLLETPTKVKIGRLIKGNETTNATNLLLHTTDTGGEGGEIHLSNSSKYFHGKISDRNLATITSTEQFNTDLVVDKFNAILNEYRNKYDSCFLTNFLAGKDGVMRKRISFVDSYKLIALIIEGKI